MRTPNGYESTVSAGSNGSWAGVDAETVHRAVNELHLGHAVVLIDLRDVDAIKCSAQLEQVANAA